MITDKYYKWLKKYFWLKKLKLHLPLINT